MLISSDARSDDDAGRNAQLLARQVDHLGWLNTTQLIDGQRVAIDTARAQGVV